MVRHGEILSCHCGKLRGRLTRVAPETGSLVICYCRDCRAYARHLGAHAALDGHGGTEIYQTTPDNIEIEQGAEHLAALRLSEKGLIRWYASCCRTPVANTLARPGFAFAGMPVVVFPEPEARDRMGPLISAVFTKQADPPAPKLRDFGVLRAGAALMWRHLRARWSGRRATPFFDAAGHPAAPPHVLTEDERRAAYAEAR